MKVNVFKPKNAVLRNYIDCFYILKKTATEPTVNYITFPAVFPIVSFTQHATVKVNNQKIHVKQNTKAQVESFLVTRFNKPFAFVYEGEIQEITIYFKPLGLYSFLNQDLNKHKDGTSFFPFPDFKKAILSVFKQKKDEDKIACLEKYLMTKQNQLNHPFLHQCIEDISDVNNVISMASLAKKYKLSSKNLIKHFERHTCKTPSEYRKIIRFRAALQKYSQNPESVSLTELTYILNYFDQAHFNREFKSITGFTPKQFFKKLTPLEYGKINWIFE